MSVVHKGTNTAASTSVAIPSHLVGDLILISAYRDGVITPPTKPAASGTVPAWVTVDGPSGGNLNSMISCVFVATATNHTSGTWTNATGMTVTVVSGQKAGTGLTPIGGHAQGGTANSTGFIDLSLGNTTLQDTSGASMILRQVGARFVTNWNSLAGSGFTDRGNTATEVLVCTKDVTTSEDTVGDDIGATFSANGGFRVQGIEILVGATPVSQSVAISYNVREYPKPVWTLMGSNHALSGGTTLVATMTRNQDAGTLLVVAYRCGSAATITIADSRGNTVFQQDLLDNSQGNVMGVFSYRPTTLLQTGDTITLTYSATGTRSMLVYQVAGIAQTSWKQTAISASAATGTAIDSGSTSVPGAYYELFGTGISPNGSVYTAGNNGAGQNYTILDQLVPTSPGSRLTTTRLTVYSQAGSVSYKETATMSASGVWEQGLVFYKADGIPASSISVAYSIKTSVTKSVSISYSIDPPTWTELGRASFASGSGGLTTQIPIGQNQTPGTIIVVLARIATVGSNVCSDSRGGNTYQLDAIRSDGTNIAYAWSCKPVNLLQSGDTVNVTFATTSARQFLVYQVSKLDQTTWFNSAAVANGTSTAPDSGNLSLTAGRYEFLGFNTCGSITAVYTSTDNGQGKPWLTLSGRYIGSASTLVAEHMAQTVPSTLNYKAYGTLSASVTWHEMLVAYNIAQPPVFKSLTVSYAVPAGLIYVPQALVVNYTTVGRISKTQALSYTVKQTIAKTVAPSYTVRKPIVKTLALNYSVKASITKTVTPAYFIRTTVAVKSLVLSYLIRKAIARAISPTYSVKGGIVKTFTFNFALHGGISKTQAVAYNVRAYRSNILALNYRVDKQLTKSLSTAYKINHTVAVKSLAVSYNIRPPAVSAAVAVSYFILGGIKQTVAATYAVQRTVAKSLPLTYRVFFKIAKALAVNYTVRNTISDQISVSYRLRRTISKQCAVSYRLINTISKSRAFSYTVHRAVAKSLAPSYRVQQRVTVSLVPAYKVRRQVSKPLAASYRVRTSVSRSLVVSYRLRVVLAKTPRFTYNVCKQVRASVVISYRLRVVRARPLNLTYKLQAQIRRSATISYGVSGHLSAHLELAYRIREDILIPGDDPVSANFKAALLSAKIPSWAT